jgi:hypothetical protein
MHRTTADGHVIENGKRLFEDQDLPLKPGTADTAGYNNAVQEELCNIVELTGGTLATDENTDRNGGWRQVYDAIFENGNIKTESLKDGAVTAPKLASPLESAVAWRREWTGGALVNMHLVDGISSRLTAVQSGTQTAETTVMATGTKVRGMGTKDTVAKYEAGGITFEGADHVGSAPIAWATFELPSALKHLGVPPSTSTAASTGFTLSRANPTDPAIQLPVPATLPILAAHVRYTAAGGAVCTVPALLALTPSHACTDINVICDAQPASPFLPPDLTKPITITVMYDASAI